MILIGIGANLPSGAAATPLQTCESAVTALRMMFDTAPIALSNWYASEPMPRSSQPVYTNGVICLYSDCDPACLLAALHAIERAHGRTRSVANAARTLDLDIIAMDDLIRASPDPIIPHPRMHQRAFVLRPMLDVAPHWRHPICGLSVAEMLAKLPDQHVEPIGLSHLRNSPAQPS